MSDLQLRPEPESVSVLIVDDDPMVREAVLAMLERSSRRVVACGDAASAELALSEFSFTHVVSDLQLSQVPFEGVTFVDTVRRTLPDSRIVVITGYLSPIVKSAALAVGADAFLAKPFGAEEMAYALRLEAAEPDDIADEPLRVSEIGELLDGEVIPRFQPIVDLFGVPGAVHGYEALARVPAGWPFRDMSTLFEYARRKNRSEELNAVCAERAIATGAPLLDRGLLFINVSPDSIGTPRVLDAFRTAVAGGIDPKRIVIEITEGAPFDAAEVVSGIETLRNLGLSFAIDDSDKAADNLRLIEQIRPAYMKIGHEVGEAFHRDPQKTAIVRRVAALAAALSAEVVLEGVDSRETMLNARRLGIRYGQGFWLGAPMEASVAARHRWPDGRSETTSN